MALDVHSKPTLIALGDHDELQQERDLRVAAQDALFNTGQEISQARHERDTWKARFFYAAGVCLFFGAVLLLGIGYLLGRA